MVQNHGLRRMFDSNGRRCVAEEEETAAATARHLVEELPGKTPREDATCDPAFCSHDDDIISQPHMRLQSGSIATTGDCFHNSFLSRTILDLKN